MQQQSARRATIARSKCDWAAFGVAAEGAILKATRIGYQGLLQALDIASRTLPRGLSQVGGEPTSIIAELTRSSKCESNGWQYLAAPRVQAPILIGGRWLTTDRQKGKAFREHFAAAGSTSEAVAQRLATAAARLDTGLGASTGDVAPITTWEAEQVVHVTRRTAPGPDGILIEMLAGTVLRVAVGAMNDSLLCGRVPDGWCLVDVVPVAKGGRDPTTLEGYRQVGLSSVVYSNLIVHIHDARSTADMYRSFAKSPKVLGLDCSWQSIGPEILCRAEKDVFVCCALGITLFFQLCVKSLDCCPWLLGCIVTRMRTRANPSTTVVRALVTSDCQRDGA